MGVGEHTYPSDKIFAGTISLQATLETNVLKEPYQLRSSASVQVQSELTLQLQSFLKDKQNSKPPNHNMPRTISTVFHEVIFVCFTS